jgi:UDP-N-acetylglucosamine--N-acetylmuramyl-(pentapeptide) pyrophosphoryl-undecaprenol N-acetylglucosamine transferase
MENSMNPTILFQAPNGVGLGHINRLAAVALAIRDKVPAARLLFLLEGGSHSLLETFSLPYFSLPNPAVLYLGETWAAWPGEKRYDLMYKVADCIIDQLNPHLILFDSFPSVPIAMAAAERGVPLALCLRKSKNMRAYLAEMKNLFREQLKYLDLILVPHEPNEVKLPDQLMPKMRFIGRIVRPSQKANGGMDIPSDSRIVVISGGGGGYPNTVDFYNLALASFASSRTRNPDLEGILITGPLFQDWWNLRMVDGVRVIPFDPNLTSTLAAADLIICQAGYNTIAEIMHLQAPTICVPADRIWDNQFERAEHTAAARPNFYVFRDSDVNQLTNLIDTCLHIPQQSRRGAEFSSMGAIRAAESILELIADGSPSRIPRADKKAE